MKNKIIYIFILFAFVILVIFSVLIYIDSSKITKAKKTKILEIFNWDIVKNENYYTLNYNIPKNENSDFLENKCDIYVVDKDNNLLFKIMKINFEKESNMYSILHVVEYDISEINKIIVISSESAYKYNKDLMKKNFLGEKIEVPQDVIVNYELLNEKYSEELPKTE